MDFIKIFDAFLLIPIGLIIYEEISYFNYGSKAEHVLWISIFTFLAAFNIAFLLNFI